MRGLLLALVAIIATGESWHAHAAAVHTVPGATLTTGSYASTVAAVAAATTADAGPDEVASDDIAGEHATADLIGRRIERPLPFLAGQGALESLLEINPRVNIRSTERIDGPDGAATGARPGDLSQLRVRLATWQHAAIARLLARASQGALHQFSTAPPLSIT